jgi:CRISPR-associated protein Csb2
MIRAVEADVVVLAVDGKVRPRVVESIRVGDEIRRSAMGAHKRVMGGDPTKLSATFSGKDADGHKLVDHHRHASFLSWDRDGDGVIDHVLVSSPTGFDRDELLALHRLAPLALPSREHRSRLIPVAVGRRIHMFVDLASNRFRSATPFLPTRHYRAKRDGDFLDWMRRQVERSLADHGMPALVGLEQLEHHALDDRRRVRWLEFRRSRSGDMPQLGFGFELMLNAQVRGPFSIGAGAHFGLGMFVPIC